MFYYDYFNIIVAPDGAPVNVRTEYSTGTTAEFLWNEIPCGSRKGQLEYYYYEVSVNGSQDSGEKMDTSHRIDNLQCGKVSFRVTGVTGAGSGPTSDTVEFDVNLSSKF